MVNLWLVASVSNAMLLPATSDRIRADVGEYVPNVVVPTLIENDWKSDVLV